MAAADDEGVLARLARDVLGALEDQLGPGDDTGDPAALERALGAVRDLAIEFVRRYHRLEVELEVGALTEPALFVANHGFGGIFDLNVLAVGAALQDLGPDRPITILTHQLAWTVGIGPLIEHAGARPASHDSAHRAFALGHHVVVFPGGDLDAFKSFADRNQVVFGGRTGFARLALDEQVPIVPIVTAGAGESLLALSGGEQLARALRLDKLLRVKRVPITLSVPWGVNVGAVGLLPYLPLPSKLHTRVLPAVRPLPGEDAGALADRVHTSMQEALTAMTAHRRPLLG